MADVVVLGAGLGGLGAAFEMRSALGREHRVTVVNAVDTFRFTPSNPWVAVGWRKPGQVTVPLERVLRRRGIELRVGEAAEIRPGAREIGMGDGSTIHYDALVVATGPKLSFDEVSGLGPAGFTESICTLEHAERARARYRELTESPGPIVVGAAQGASCFGPAYEFAMILDTDLRRRRIRHKVPMTFVTSEPYIGHLGLGGVGDSKGLLESKMRERDITWISNAKIKEVKEGEIAVVEHGPGGEPLREHVLPFKLGMILPSFKGVDAVAKAGEICNPRGFLVVDSHQRNPKHPSIFGVGVCVAIAPPEPTPVPTGVPKTGYMIESMVSAAVANVKEELAGGRAEHTATWNAVCLADFGDTGMAFVALPQIPPRNVTWTKEGRWVHLAKVAFERYYLRKMRSGSAEPVFEKYALRALGIKRLSA